MAIKQRVSERGYLNKDGGAIDDITAATGASYSLVQADGTDDKGKAKYVPVETFTRQFGGSPADIMYGIFGFHTKIGNVVNTVLNNEKQPGTIDEAINAVKEFMAGVDSGVWREPGAGVGPRYDVAILAKAIAAVTGKPESEYSSKMDWRVDQRTGARTAPEADGSYAKGSLTYPVFAMRNKAVAGKYAELGGSTGKEVDVAAL